MTKKKKEEVKQDVAEDIVLDTDTQQEVIEDDIVFEEENLTDSKVAKKLRERLKKCEEEKKEYLDGWQRMKADVVNNKKYEIERLKRVGDSAKESLLADIIPVLDSFDMAFKGEAWSKVDDVWQKGVEYIHTQFIQALENNGALAYGAIGDTFDPMLHDASEEKDTDNKEDDGKIISINRMGYKIGDRVVRPAQVVVAKFKK